MINPGDHDSMILAARIVSGELKGEAAIGHAIVDLVEKHRRKADAAAVERMSRPLDSFTRGFAQGIQRAEELAAGVRNLDSAEGLLAIYLKWACEELRRRDDSAERAVESVGRSSRPSAEREERTSDGPDDTKPSEQPGDLYVEVRVFRMFQDPAENDDVVRFVGPLRNQPGWAAQLGDPICGPGGEKYFSVKIVTG